MKQDLLKVLSFLPEHLRKTRRGQVLNLDLIFDEYRQGQEISSNCLDLILMAYRYYHVFDKSLKEFQTNKIKPKLLKDLLLVSFSALMSRKAEKESLLIFQSVEAAKTRFGPFAGKICNAFLRNTQKEKEKILKETILNPEIVLGPYLSERWKNKFSRQELTYLAQKILARPKAGIEAFDETLEWKRWASSDFKNSSLKRQAMRKSSWDYCLELKKQIEKNRMLDGEEKSLLDACAAPGGKLIALQNLLRETKLNFYGTEAKYPRYTRLQENIKTWNLEENTTLSLHSWGQEEKNTPEFPEKSDYIVADLPCSGLGTLANRPDLLLIDSQYSWNNLFQLQKDILKDLLSAQKSQGTLFVSICSIDPLEIENISQFLESKQPAERTKLEGQEYSEFLCSWQIPSAPLS